jgi:hypothetical protein
MITGLIYKISCDTTQNIYIGSTFKTIQKRLSQHESAYRLFIKTQCKYLSSFEVLKNGNYKIECIETIDNISKMNLKLLEQMHILNNSCVNINVPCRTSRDRYQMNRIRNINKSKQYYYNHLLHCRDRMKKYYMKNKQILK